MDTTKKRRSHEKILQEFEHGKADILVGTQMISKGLDFPNVTLVGVISTDTSLSLPDFRADEKTFSLLTQVAGRSGRGEKMRKGFWFCQEACRCNFVKQQRWCLCSGPLSLFYSKDIV